MKTLYVVSRTPFLRKEFKTNIALADSGDAVVFIQDGVLVATRIPEDMENLIENAKNKGVKFYLLKEDLEARGLKKNWMEVVDYEGFLELLLQYERAVN